MDVPLPAVKIESLRPADHPFEDRRKKVDKGLDTRKMDSWERYRALSDLLDNYADLSEYADRKARFALVVMGALNALNVIAAAQPNLLVGLRSGAASGWLGAYIVGYAALSVYFVVHAINTLRPRLDLFPNAPATGALAGPSGLRFMADINPADSVTYYQRWTSATVGQVNEELAQHVQVLARLCDVKFRTLGRVYRGLLGMAMMTAAMTSVLMLQRLR
jgi:hypothetical protein